MTRVLFWNIDERELAGEIGQLCAHYGVDILAIAEPISPPDIISALFSSTGRLFVRLELAVRLHVYSALPANAVTVSFDHGGFVAVHVEQLVGPTVSIVFAHLSSKMGQTAGGADMLATRARSQIEALERQVGHRRTLVIGDLNMEPYDPGLISSESFHATMSERIGARGTRIVQGEERSFFYNPMWNFLGDKTPGPPGTFFRNKSEPNAYYWHMIDQVLIRPDAIPLVNSDSIEIVREAGPVRLDNEHGHPHASDHFPLLVTIGGRAPRNATQGPSNER